MNHASSVLLLLVVLLLLWFARNNVLTEIKASLMPATGTAGTSPPGSSTVANSGSQPTPNNQPVTANPLPGFIKN